MRPISDFSMQITALFFAAYRDLTGTEELPLRLERGSRISDLVRTLRDRGGSWARLPAEPAVAVNQEYARLDALLSDGDEVAFIPPVSGG